LVSEIDDTRCRYLAKTLAASVKKYVEDKKITGIVFATCHDDFIPWLQPDWVFSTQTHELAILTPSEPPEVVVACRSYHTSQGSCSDLLYVYKAPIKTFY
jgi:hypothetical protein